MRNYGMESSISLDGENILLFLATGAGDDEPMQAERDNTLPLAIRCFIKCSKTSFSGGIPGGAPREQALLTQLLAAKKRAFWNRAQCLCIT